MFRNKIFIFDELNYPFLPLAILLRIIRQKVYFFRLTKTWQNEKSIKFLEFIGLRWLNYQDYKIKNIVKVSQDCLSLQREIGDFMDSLNIANDLKEKLVEMGCNANDLKSLVLTMVANRLREFCELGLFLDHIRASNKNDFVIVGEFPYFFYKILSKKIGNKALILNFYYFQIISSIFKLIFNKIKFDVKNSHIKNKKTNSVNNKIDLKKFNIIFFPHQGIYYGSFFKKDQFYSKKTNSNFYPSNILHFSTGEENEDSELTNEFYKKKKIINIDFTSLGNLSLQKIILETWKFIKKYYFFSKNNLRSVFFFLYVWLLIKQSLIRLKTLPNAKIAIFGYDLVSPRHIAIACRIKGIETIATQERFLCAWDENSFFVLDHYLTINKDVEKHILNERLGSVKKVKSIGPVRSDLIDMKMFEENTNIKKIVLVLDVQSYKEFYRNGLAKQNSWDKNYIFYEDILRLARKNQNIKFIIKGKNYYFVDIPYFRDIKNQINEAPNVELYDDKKNSPYELIKNSPYELIKKISLTIAIHTSVVDELLFKERPVIIYSNAEGYPIYYNENLLVKNYEELESKFNLWKEDPKKFNETIINEIRKYFPINKSEDSVYDLLHTYLENEIKHYF